MSEITLRQGDCLELMKEIPDKSIDMVLCDLPFEKTDCNWDKFLPIKSVWEQYNRIITNVGAIVLFGSEPFSSQLRLSNIDMYKYDWIWIKTRASNFMNAKLQPLKIQENISVFSKGKASNGGNPLMKYNPQGITRVDKRCNNSRTVGGEVNKNRGKSFDNKSYNQEYTGYPVNVLTFDSQKGFHPTQKPVPLLEYLIRTYTNEGETVLDNCMGSGSTGVAAKNLNRNFYGIELDEHYFEIAKNRIESA